MSAALEQKPNSALAHSVIDEVELRLVQAGVRISEHGEDIEGFPVKHHFTPGLYCREIFMPAKSVVVSRVHKTEHPFVVSRGRCCVFNESGEWTEINAPYFGITKPGTRRFLVMLEDTVWTTFHPTTKTDVREIELDIIEPHRNALLEEVTQ